MNLGLIYLGLLICPSILFAHKIDNNHYTVYSDNKIDDNIKFVIDDAVKRVSKSDLYDSKIQFYICNKL